MSAYVNGEKVAMNVHLKTVNVPVDDMLSEESSNAISNKAVAEAIAEDRENIQALEEELTGKASFSEEDSGEKIAGKILIGNLNGDGTISFENLSIGNLDTVNRAVLVIQVWTNDKGEKSYQIGASSIDSNELATKKDITAGVPESKNYPIEAGYVLIGSNDPEEPGYVARSDIKLDDLLTMTSFGTATEFGYIPVLNPIGDGKTTIVNSGFNVLDFDNRTKEFEHIKTYTLGSAAAEYIISKDKDEQPFTLRDRITVYIEVPQAQEKGNVYLQFGTKYAGLSMNALTTGSTKTVTRISFVWNGYRWENYSAGITHTTGASNIQVNTVPKYDANASGVSSITIIAKNSSGQAMNFPEGTVFRVYARRGE